MDVHGHVSYDELPQQPHVELVARCLTLEPLGLAVRIEDVAAKEVAEEAGEPVALWVVVEVSTKHVLNNDKVRSEDIESNVKEAEDDGVGGGKVDRHQLRTLGLIIQLRGR